jgi:hypothetical protein
MFVWAFRDKGSEWGAVRNVVKRAPVGCIPLVEAACERFAPKTDGTPKDPAHVIRQFAGRLANLGTRGQVWVDLHNLLRIHSPSTVVALSREMRLAPGLSTPLITPVVRTSSPDQIVEEMFDWATQSGSGLCLRVDGATHLEAKSRKIRELIAEAGLGSPSLDVVIDAHDLPRTLSHQSARDHFPIGQTARTYALIAGTFPRSITEMSPDDYEHFLERGEWVEWRTEMAALGQWRQPLYGDVATQPALYEPSPGHPGSPSVRYTTENTFVVLRGRGGYRGVGTDYSQYVGHALYMRQQPWFCQITRTGGDEYVDKIASNVFGSGNLTTWRIASLKLHVAVVAAQTAQVTVKGARQLARAMAPL